METKKLFVVVVENHYTTTTSAHTKWEAEDRVYNDALDRGLPVTRDMCRVKR